MTGRHIDLGNPVAAHPLTAGLVGFWLPLANAAGGSRLFDLVGGLTGTLANAPAFRPEGGGLHSLELDSGSDQYADLGDPAALQFSGSQPYTIALRYRLTTAPAAAASYQLFAKDAETGGRAYTLDLFSPGVGAKGFRFYVNGGAGGAITSDELDPAAGDDRIVMATFSAAGTLQIYTNGLARGTPAGPGFTTPTATANVLVGRREYAGAEEPLDGRIYWAAAWDRALSASEAWAWAEQARLGHRDALRRWSRRVYGTVAAAAFDAAEFPVTCAVVPADAPWAAVPY